jgi:hypothetical protein
MSRNRLIKCGLCSKNQIKRAKLWPFLFLSSRMNYTYSTTDTDYEYTVMNDYGWSHSSRESGHGASQSHSGHSENWIDSIAPLNNPC